MAKLEVFDKPGVGTGYIFWCPGCGTNHSYDVRTDGGHPSWSFNGDMDRPTFTPSLFYPQRVCHFYLTDGMIHFLADCTHKLAGQSLPLEDIP